MTQLTGDLQWLMRHKGRMRQRDGAIIDPVVDDVNGIQWFFQFRKYHKGPYKWFAMGKQEPLWAQYTSTITPTPINTWVFSTTFIVIPFSGMYWFRLDSHSASAVVSQLLSGLSIDQAAPPTSGTESFATASGEAKLVDWESQTPQEVMAGHSLYAAFQTNILGPFSNNGTAKAQPVRVNF